MPLSLVSVCPAVRRLSSNSLWSVYRDLYSPRECYVSSVGMARTNLCIRTSGLAQLWWSGFAGQPNRFLQNELLEPVRFGYECKWLLDFQLASKYSTIVSYPFLINQSLFDLVSRSVGEAIKLIDGPADQPTHWRADRRIDGLTCQLNLIEPTDRPNQPIVWPANRPLINSWKLIQFHQKH